MRRLAVALLTSLVAMSASAAELTVAAAYRERIATPPGSTVSAAILDVARADAPAIEIARAQAVVHRGPPFTLVIAHDPAARDPRGRYAVRAEIRLPDGSLFFTTDTHVSAPAETAAVEIMLVKAGDAPPKPAPDAPAASPADLVGPSWAPVEIGGAAAPADTKAHLVFDHDGRIAGDGGCNRIGASYIARPDGAFLAGLGFSTMMACPEPIMATESAMHDALNRARAWSIEGERLILKAADGAALAILAKRAAE